jgi:hypothetical protein
MTTQILYIDDQLTDVGAQRIQERLMHEDVIRCNLISPPAEIANLGNLIENPPDIFLVDQDLTTQVDYYGSTLVAEIRVRFPEYPIVIITRKSVLKDLGTEKSRQLAEEMQTFDELILKGFVDDHPVKVQQQLTTLSEGFRILRGIGKRTWANLMEALKAEEGEEDVLREAAPPLPRRGAPYEDKKGSWTVTGAANWLRNVVLEYPGILYDSIHAATRLGISEEDFRRDEVQRELEGAMYDGVFAPPDGRWWKERLLGNAQELITEQEIDRPINEAFAEAFFRKYQYQLAPARCVWDGTALADRVCYVLREPVKTENSLRYYPDNRPSIMEQGRVSFRAVQSNDDFDEEHLDSAGRKLLRKIMVLPDPKTRAA